MCHKGNTNFPHSHSRTEEKKPAGLQMSLWQVVSGNNGEWCVESGKSFYLIAFNSQWLQHSLVRIWPQYTQKFNFYLLRQVMTGGYTHTPTQPHLIIILFKCLLCCCCRFLWHSTGLCLLLTLLIQVKQSDVYIVYQSYAPLSTHTHTHKQTTHTHIQSACPLM